MKIEFITNNDNYITVTFTDGLVAYGVLITKATNTVEFMKWKPTDIEAITINEQTDPDYLEVLKEKYLPRILEHIEKH